MNVDANPIKQLKIPNSLFTILLLVVLFIGILLPILNLKNVAARSPDEQIYTYQAGIIARQGTEGIKSLVREYNTNREAWKYPPPIRVGYLCLLAGVMKMTNNTDVKAGAYLSCFFSVISLLLLILVGLKFFNRWITLYALLFMSVSPMALAIARRTWQEAILGCIGLLLIYFCCELTRSAHKIIWYILFVITGSYCILIKSSGALIYGLCIAWLLWVLFVKEKSLLRGGLLIAFITLGAGISIALLSYLSGGISAIGEVLLHMKEGLRTSTYLNHYCSGPWYQFIELLWIVSPVNTVLFFVGMIGAFLLKESDQKAANFPISKNRGAIFGIIFFMIGYMTILFLGKQYHQNLRYVSVIYVPFYLISGLGFWCIISFTKKILKNLSFSIAMAGIAAIIIFVAMTDYQIFKRVIVNSGIKDLSIGLLRKFSY